MPDLLRSLKILALTEVVATRSSDYTLRKVMRWYSEKFHTPLHLVYDLDLEWVLQHYYESTFEDLEGADLQAAILEATKSDEALVVEEAAAAAAAAQAERAAAQFEKDFDDLEIAPRLPAAKKPDALALTLAPATPSALAEAPPPNISMTFADLGDIEKWAAEIDSRGTMTGLK